MRPPVWRADYQPPNFPPRGCHVTAYRPLSLPPRECQVTAYRPHLQPDTAGDADFLPLQEATLWNQNSTGIIEKETSCL
jgi:hypothetical protein